MQPDHVVREARGHHGGCGRARADRDGGVSAAAPAESAAQSTAASSVVYFNTILNQWSRWRPDAGNSSHTG